MMKRSYLLIAVIISGLLQASRPAEPVSQINLFQWGLAARQGDRPSMEDEHTHVMNFGGQASQAFFAIYDGHGGEAAAATIASHVLHGDLLIHLKAGKKVEQSFIQAFQYTDQEIMKRTDVGACALAAYINGNQAYIAWAGDSRAIVVRNGKVIATTVDHKPDSPNEKARLASKGIEISSGRVPRVFGLAISRALGDKPLKERGIGGIIATPDIIKVLLEPGDLIVLACDGVWDEIDNEQAAQLVSDVVARKNLQKYEKDYYKGPRFKDLNEADSVIDLGNNELLELAARVLRDTAYTKGSLDNISAMVIQYNAPAPKQVEVKEKASDKAVRKQEIRARMAEIKREREEAEALEAIRKSKENKKPAEVKEQAAGSASKKQVIIDRLTELKEIAEDSKLKKPVIQQIENVLLLLQKEPYTFDVLSIAFSLLNDINGDTEIEYFGQKTKLSVFLEPIEKGIEKEVDRLRPIYRGREW